jgi:hypothetical protein
VVALCVADTHRHTQTHRDTQRHTETHTDTHRDTHRHTHTDTQTQTHTDAHTHTHTHSVRRVGLATACNALRLVALSSRPKWLRIRPKWLRIHIHESSQLYMVKHSVQNKTLPNTPPRCWPFGRRRSSEGNARCCTNAATLSPLGRLGRVLRAPSPRAESDTLLSVLPQGASS